MKRILKLTVALFLLLVIARVLLGGDEDTWVCKEGAWVKHGNPSTPSPSVECITKVVQ